MMKTRMFQTLFLFSFLLLTPFCFANFMLNQSMSPQAIYAAQAGAYQLGNRAGANAYTYPASAVARPASPIGEVSTYGGTPGFCGGRDAATAIRLGEGQAMPPAGRHGAFQ